MMGIYVHLPFCLRKCPYCAFFSMADAEDKMEPYIYRIINEANTYPSQKVGSIYFGGGTPSVLPTSLLKTLLREILKRFPCDGEITIEVNPATVTKASLCELFDAGFNRISIGVQSLNNSELSFLGRLHSVEEAVLCVQHAKEAGFQNISADIMFGLPKQTKESVLNTLQGILALPVTHISAYSLSIEDGTPFARKAIAPLDEEAEREIYYAIRDTLKENGFIHYEISNFARPGMEAVHNQNYWKCGEYIGLGAGAHGYVDGVRYANTENIDDYLKSENPHVSSVRLSETDRQDEYFMLGLRMLQGVKDNGNPNIPRLIRDGLLEKNGEYIRLSMRGLDIANYVITELCS